MLETFFWGIIFYCLPTAQSLRLLTIYFWIFFNSQLRFSTFFYKYILITQPITFPSQIAITIEKQGLSLFTLPFRKFHKFFQFFLHHFASLTLVREKFFSHHRSFSYTSCEFFIATLKHVKIYF